MTANELRAATENAAAAKGEEYATKLAGLNSDAKTEQKVLETFFENGRLKQLPAKRNKRDICFKKILEAFEAGRSYPEKEVNEIISQFYDDYCIVRRWAVDEGYMNRIGNVYTLRATDSEKNSVL